MTKRSVALVGVLVVMAMIGSSVIGAVSAWATSDAANGTYSVFLPLIMNAIGAMAEVPQGAVMTFNLTSCPSGWTEVIDAQGRAIVGLPSAGTLSGTVGSGLGNLEDRNHSHDVNPSSISSGSVGDHDHAVNPPAFQSGLGGQHAHDLLGGISISSNNHIHRWTEYDNKQWQTFNASGTLVSIFTWGDGMDSGGDGNYPLSRNSTTSRTYYTDWDSHSHTADFSGQYTDTEISHDHNIDVPIFTSDNSGSHSHSVNIPNTSSTTASTSDIMPYIQFLVCEKD